MSTRLDRQITSKRSLGALGARLAVAGVLAWLGVAPAVVASEPPDGQRRPDIILILIDTLRADHLSCYGYARDTSPAMDAIAAEGLVFTDAVAAAPWTVPSVASVFSSLYPNDHGVLKHNPPKPNTGGAFVTNVLATHFTTLAESLRDAGYATAAVVANPWLCERFGFGQGFDVYKTTSTWKMTGEGVNAEALSWLRQRDDDKPFFLYLHYIEPHSPYNAPPQFRAPYEAQAREMVTLGQATPLTDDVKGFIGLHLEDKDPAMMKYLEYWIARYDACIRECDSYIGSLRRSLEELGVWTKAFVVITSDHGEEFAEHGACHHGYSLYADQLHVPLIIHTPWRVPPARVDATVSLLDLATTLWDVGGAEVPADAQGTSLLPMIRHTEARRPSFAFAEGVKNKPAYVSAQYRWSKVIADTETGERRYYDLRLDPKEQRPSRTPLDEVATRLGATLDAWLGERGKREPTPAPEATIDPETAELLRHLGYLDDEQKAENH